MGRSQFRLDDTFNKEGMFGSIWDDWDSKTPEERREIEDRYERNRNYKGMNKNYE
jgi:hypothetical protein